MYEIPATGKSYIQGAQLQGSPSGSVASLCSMKIKIEVITDKNEF